MVDELLRIMKDNGRIALEVCSLRLRAERDEATIHELEHKLRTVTEKLTFEHAKAVAERDEALVQVTTLLAALPKCHCKKIATARSPTAAIGDFVYTCDEHAHDSEFEEKIDLRWAKIVRAHYGT